MNEYRVTKYNPAFRDASGVYTRDEWISFDDVGRSFDGVVLTRCEYQLVEDAYVAAAIAFLREAAVPQLTVRGLENAGRRPLPFGEADAVTIQQLADALRGLLREEFWCRFESSDAFVHVGWDYYMYIGVPDACPAAKRCAEGLGLYVECVRSPYGGGSAAA
jgi:hypothetical protein